MPTMSANGAVQPISDTYPENGRRYHSFRKGLYMYPCDEDEKDRMDIYHKIFEVARRNKIHEAPFTVDPNVPPRILDLGCGTGIWAIDMADKFPTAEVIGLDLVNIQPEKIPPNLRFRVPRDYEGSLWSLGEDSFDMIHLQMASGSVQDWPELYQKIFAHLKPGHGWIEQVEIDMQPRCDDGTLASNSMLNQWYNYLADATARGNKSIAYNHNTRQMLQEQGFIDIQEMIIRAPLNPWPVDPHQKLLGRWYNLGLTDGLEALSMQPFTRINKWDGDRHVRPLVREVNKEVSNPKVHAYNNIHIWIARRPMS